MAGYRHVLFDFDGVLCDSLERAAATFNELRADFPTLPEVATKDDMVRVYGGSLKTCLRNWLSVAEHQEFFRRHSGHMATLSQELCLFPGVHKLVRDLPRGVASIVTSAYSHHVRAVMEGAKPRVNPLHFYAIAGHELAATKTEKIVNIVESLNLELRDCVYVGDLESDLLYCRDVPIDMIAVSYGYHPRWHLESLDADYLVDSVTELGETLAHVLVDS